MSFDLLLTDEAVCLDKAPGDPEAKVVACDSEKAAYQLVGKGQPISEYDASRFGVKTTKADATNYTLRIDSHTIARTPEDKAFALTQPQPGLVAAQAEQIRASAALGVAALTSAHNAATVDAANEAKKTDEEADKKIKANLAAKAAEKPKAQKTAKATKARKATKKTTAKKKEEAATPATP